MIYGGVLLIYMVYHLFYAHAVVNVPLLAVIMMSLLALDRFEYLRFGEAPPKYVAVLFLLYRLVLIELIGLHVDIYYLSFLYAFLPFIAVMQLGWLAGLFAGFSVWILYVFRISRIYPWWSQNILHVDAFLTFHIMLGFTLTMAIVVLREKRSRQQTENLLKELKQSNQQLRDYADQIETLAIIQERSRLARDIHDTLGHYLTAMSIQLEKATVFFEQKPDAARASMQQSKLLADEALREVRHSVGVLRSAAQTFSLQDALERMINRIQSNNLTVRLDVIGDADTLPDPLLMSLYRAAQEGLTNIQKHANASEVLLRVCVESQSVTMLIQDNGRGFIDQPSQGYGLHGLRERLRLVGGTLDITSQPGTQTQLKILIPMGGAS